VPYNWGPHYIVPSEVYKTYSGVVLLREGLDESLLKKELEVLHLSGPVSRVDNPWYYRKKDTETWIKIGESSEKGSNFPVKWNTRPLENGRYEIMGLMHVHVTKDRQKMVIARQNIVEVTVEN